MVADTGSVKDARSKIGSCLSHLYVALRRCQPTLLALFWSRPDWGFWSCYSPKPFLFCFSAWNLNLPGVWRHLWWGVDRSLCQFLASSVNFQWDRNQCNTQCWWCFLRNGRPNIRIPQKYCNEDRQWCSRRGRHAGHTCQPVRLADTGTAQSPSDYNQKKDAAYLSFSSSLGRRAKSKATSKASMHVHQDIKPRYHKAGITWAHPSVRILGKEAVEMLCLTFSCCLGRHKYFLKALGRNGEANEHSNHKPKLRCPYLAWNNLIKAWL